MRSYTVNFTSKKGMSAKPSETFPAALSFGEVVVVAVSMAAKGFECYTFTIISPEGVVTHFWSDGRQCGPSHFR